MRGKISRFLSLPTSSALSPSSSCALIAHRCRSADWKQGCVNNPSNVPPNSRIILKSAHAEPERSISSRRAQSKQAAFTNDHRRRRQRTRAEQERSSLSVRPPGRGTPSSAHVVSAGATRGQTAPGSAVKMRQGPTLSTSRYSERCLSRAIE